MRFTYTCERCGFNSVSARPDLERCTIPVYGDGEPVILTPNERRTYADFARCDGDLDGPYCYWFDVPDDLRDLILAREATDERP